MADRLQSIAAEKDEVEKEYFTENELEALANLKFGSVNRRFGLRKRIKRTRITADQIASFELETKKKKVFFSSYKRRKR